MKSVMWGQAKTNKYIPPKICWDQNDAKKYLSKEESRLLAGTYIEYSTIYSNTYIYNNIVIYIYVHSNRVYDY